MTDNPFRKIARKKKNKVVENEKITQNVKNLNDLKEKNEIIDKTNVFTQQPKVNKEEDSKKNRQKADKEEDSKKNRQKADKEEDSRKNRQKADKEEDSRKNRQKADKEEDSRKNRQKADKEEEHEHDDSCCPKCKSTNFEKCSSFYEKNKYNEAKCEPIYNIIPKTPVQVAVENIWFSVFLALISAFIVYILSKSQLGCISAIILIPTLSFVFNGINKYIARNTNIFDIFLTPLSKINWKKINIRFNNKIPLVVGISTLILTPIGIFMKSIGDSVDLTQTGWVTIVICLCAPLVLFVLISCISWIFRIFFIKDYDQYNKELEEWDKCFICDDCKNVFILDDRKIDNEYKQYSSVIELDANVLKRLHELEYFKAEVEKNYRRGIPEIGGISIEDKIVKTGEKLHFCEIDIPNVYTDNEINYKINSIGDFLFSSVKSLVRVSIPSSVTKIGNLAFYSLKSLKTVVLAEGVENIENCAFQNCENLMSVRPSNGLFNASEIIIPKSVEKIGDEAFAGCKSINSVIIPDTVKEIGENAFLGIRDIYYNGKAEGSPWGAFRVNNLQESKYEIETKDTKKKQEKNIFIISFIITLIIFVVLGTNYKGANYKKDYLYSDAKDSVGNVIRNKQGKAVANVDKYGNELRDDTVLGKFINGAGRELSNAFFGSKHNYITDANGNAIIARNSDGSIKYDENGNPVYIDKGPSAGFFSNLIEWVDYGFKTTGKWLISSNSSNSSNSTSNSTSNNNSNHTSNENSYVSNKPKLDPNITYKEVVLDKQTLYKLGYNPADKKNFTSVKIPYTFEFKGNHYKITKIGEKAFFNYGALQKVTIEEGVQILGVSAFENCISLKTVKLPSSINKINNNVFANCKALANVNLPEGLTELRDSIFFNCMSLKTIEIPNSVTKIGDMVFYKCKSLEKITIPENVTSIGQSAFAGCRGMTELEIPNNVTTIKQWAFSNCVSLNKVSIPDGVSVVGDEAFCNVPYVYYDGSASGQPWGALDSNKMPVVVVDDPFMSTAEDTYPSKLEDGKLILVYAQMGGGLYADRSSVHVENLYLPLCELSIDLIKVDFSEEYYRSHGTYIGGPCKITGKINNVFRYNTAKKMLSYNDNGEWKTWDINVFHCRAEGDPLIPYTAETAFVTAFQTKFYGNAKGEDNSRVISAEFYKILGIDL